MAEGGGRRTGGAARLETAGPAAVKVTDRRPRRMQVALLAYGGGVLGAVGGVATLALAIVNRTTIHDLAAADPISIVMPLTFAVVGALVASCHPRNATGWLMLTSSPPIWG